MPASMISAPTGGSPKVMGSSMAMVATEPMPGRTPINVPTSAPIRQNTRFQGVAATDRPSARLARRSFMSDSLGSEARPELERQVEQVDEQEDGKGRHDDACDNRLDPPRFRRSGTRHDERDERCNDQSERTHRGGENEDRYGDPEGTAHGIAFEGLALYEKAHGGDDNSEDEENSGE